MMKTLLSIISFTLFSLTPVAAQWSGSVKADGAWSLRQSNNENVDFKLKYTGRKFYVGSDIYFGHSYLPSVKTTTILDAKREKNEYYKGENNSIYPRKFNAGAKVDFGYAFNPNNVLDASISYGYSGKDENSILQTERYNNSNMSVLNGTQNDTASVSNHTITFAAAYHRKFTSRPDAHLKVTLSNTTKLDGEANRRITSGNFYTKQKNYATYSSINNFDSEFSAFYDDIFHFGNTDIKLKAGVDFISNQDLDGYFAETYVNGVWRDSTAYRQSYYYNSLSTEPYVNLTWSVDNFDFFIRERVQVYWHAVIDKLESIRKPEDLVGLFNKFDNRNLLNAGVTYRINDKHRFTLDYGRSITRPDYKKLCPTLMIGKSEGEYFLGNPDLLPEITDRINLGYSYTKGIFVTRLDINYRDKRNTAEKVIDLEKSKDITDPGVKTLYTWINNKRQNSYGTKLDLKMNGRDVNAEIWAAFNYDTYWRSDKVDKNDFNYEIGTSIDLLLNETTKLSSSIAYISAKQSAYNLKGEDVVANLRFSKILTKGLEIYVELKDIADKDIYEETWNADMNYLKIVSTTPMHRAALLGVNYVF